MRSGKEGGSQTYLGSWFSGREGGPPLGRSFSHTHVALMVVQAT